MLAVSSDRIVCLSTPFGKRGFFFEEWANGQLEPAQSHSRRMSPHLN